MHCYHLSYVCFTIYHFREQIVFFFLLCFVLQDLRKHVDVSATTIMIQCNSFTPESPSFLKFPIRSCMGLIFPIRALNYMLIIVVLNPLRGSCSVSSLSLILLNLYLFPGCCYLLAFQPSHNCWKLNISDRTVVIEEVIVLAEKFWNFPPARCSAWRIKFIFPAWSCVVVEIFLLLSRLPFPCTMVFRFF